MTAKESFKKMPKINPHATALMQETQYRKQQAYLHKQGFKSARDLFNEAIKYKEVFTMNQSTVQGQGKQVDFELGQLVWTRGVNSKLADDAPFAKFVANSLEQHTNGDWGNMSLEDKNENDFALGKHLRIFSAYEAEGMPKIWIITEADRSSTTILFPEEY